MMIPLGVFIFLPYLTGDWESSNMTWTSTTVSLGGWQTALVWLCVMGWSAYGVEACATFAPEYKDTARDTTLALRTLGALLARSSTRSCRSASAAY